MDTKQNLIKWLTKNSANHGSMRHTAVRFSECIRQRGENISPLNFSSDPKFSFGRVKAMQSIIFMDVIGGYLAQCCGDSPPKHPSLCYVQWTPACTMPHQHGFYQAGVAPGQGECLIELCWILAENDFSRTLRVSTDSSIMACPWNSQTWLK